MPMPILLQPLERWPWTRLPWPFPGAVFIQSSRDSRVHQQRSQDALGLFSCRPKTYVIVVTDGVSQSFFGDFAAWVLTEHLIEALCQWPEQQPFVEPRIWEAWGQQLSQQIAERYALLQPQSELTSMLQRVLEEKRRLGSETMFAAVRIDLPSKNHPQGRLRLIQGGNIRLRIWGPEGHYEAPLDEQRRWSTRRGFTAEPWLDELPLQTSQGAWRWRGLVIYTDGAPSLDAQQPPWSFEQARDILEADWHSPLSDDQAYVDIRWANGSDVTTSLRPWPTTSAPLPAPHVIAQGTTLQWSAPQGEWIYARVEAQGETNPILWTTPATQLPLPSSVKQARVQLIDPQGTPGAWSKWLRLQTSTIEATQTNAFETGALVLWVALLSIYFILLFLKGYNMLP